MGYDHRTVGFDEYDTYIRPLKDTGIPFLEGETDKVVVTDWGEHNCWCDWQPFEEEWKCHHKRRLRIAVFRDDSSQELMVAEEWLAVEDRDCDGTDVVKLAVYRLGHRPRLIKQVKPA